MVLSGSDPDWKPLIPDNPSPPPPEPLPTLPPLPLPPLSPLPSTLRSPSPPPSVSKRTSDTVESPLENPPKRAKGDESEPRHVMVAEITSTTSEGSARAIPLTTAVGSLSRDEEEFDPENPPLVIGKGGKNKGEEDQEPEYVEIGSVTFRRLFGDSV
ncbi:hypothetical protein QAD02_021469 [Eretmocerus hayati]|uniref:Uncharacterized protein n=1 Tax=Eretmocerus hayati TaxID=131215 RepID=A0ACC2PS87_9HYME|nr:hypothetical protein QAD02_021469 [Eretmocerus hayati]